MDSPKPVPLPPLDPPPSTSAEDPVPTIIVPVNGPPVDTGLRVPVERVTVEELHRRSQPDAASRKAAAPTASLPNNVAVLQAMVIELRDALAQRDHRVAELELAVDHLLRQGYRLARDHWPSDQPALFPEVPHEAVPPPDAAANLAPTPAAAAALEAATEPATANHKPQKKGHGRRSLAELLKTLPPERCEHPLTEAERLCPCCGRRRQIIGEQTSQQLEYIPGHLRCIQHVQFTYSCPSCPEHIRTAAKPPQPIDRGLAGPGLLALVTASKFDDYVPLYRQELIIARAGLFLARSTLCDWLMALGGLVQPLVEFMKQEVFRSRVVQTDGTAIAVLVEGERQARTGYFWPCLGDAAHPQVVIDFSLDKRKEHPQRFLADYRG
jgi:transposase